MTRKKASKKTKTRTVTKIPRKGAAPKTRNAGTMTESAYWSMIRSGLRRTTRYWKPIVEAKNKARRPYVGPNKRQKWEYQCAKCKKWFIGKETSVDHIIPVGSLKCKEDLPGFIERLTPESGFQVLCKEDHTKKTNSEREASKQGNKK